MSTTEELMNAWGREFLREWGHDIPDDAEIDFKDDMEYDGICDTCWMEWSVVRVSWEDISENYAGDSADLLQSMSRREHY